MHTLRCPVSAHAATVDARSGLRRCRCRKKENAAMTTDYAGKSHDEAFAARKKQKQKSQESAGGEMAVDGTQADAQHSCGELSERGKQVWRSGSGMDGGGMDGGGKP
jgi:hypothetical protein